MIGKRDKILAWLSEQEPDAVFEIDFKREKRSLNANKYFHVLCQRIAEVTHQSLSEVKNQMIAEYGQIDLELGTVSIRDSIDWRSFDSLHVRPTNQVQMLDNGEYHRIYMVMRGSHTYDTREMSILINGVVREAESVGVPTMTEKEINKLIERWKP